MNFLENVLCVMNVLAIIPDLDELAMTCNGVTGEMREALQGVQVLVSRCSYQAGERLCLASACMPILKCGL
jgi:hypothetical protein